MLFRKFENCFNLQNNTTIINNIIINKINIFFTDSEYRDSYKDEPLFFSLDNLMNGKVKKALSLKVAHGVQSDTVFRYLSEDFMKPVIREGIPNMQKEKVKQK